jgi:hypothetical protein
VEALEKVPRIFRWPAGRVLPDSDTGYPSEGETLVDQDPEYTMEVLVDGGDGTALIAQNADEEGTNHGDIEEAEVRMILLWGSFGKLTL